MNDPLGLRVVSGHPDDAELAALVAVLLAAAAPAPAAATDRRSGLWGHPATLVRAAGVPQVGGWAAPRP